MNTRRDWLKRWICVGPAPKRISATRLSGHRAARGGRHRQVLDRRDVLARFLGQDHADRHLAVAERELGRVLVDLAERGDADRLAQRAGGHAELRGEVEPRHDQQLGPLHVGGDARGDDALDALHLLDQRLRGAAAAARDRSR
jgi:hypothetical protein